MTLLLIIISYFVILLFCRNKKARVPINYDLSAIFLTICYLYLIGNSILLDEMGDIWLALKYVLFNFIFYLIMFSFIKIKIFKVERVKLLRTADSKIEFLIRKKYIWLFFAFLLLYYVFEIRGKAGYYIESIEYRRTTSGVQQYFTSLFYYIIVAPCSYIFILAAIRNRKWLLLSIYVFVMIIYALLVSRTAIIGIIFAIYYGLYVISNKRISYILVFCALFLSIVFLNVITHVRNISNLSEEIAAIISLLINKPEMVLNVFSSGEFMHPSHSLIDIINSNQHDFFIVFKDLSTLIPKINGIFRWLSPSEQYMESFYYDLYIAGRGYGFSNVALGYWWLGFPGIVIYGALCGIYFNIIIALASRKGKMSDIFCMALFLQFFNFARGSSLVGLTKNFLIMEFLPLIIGIYLLYLIIKGVRVDTGVRTKMGKYLVQL